MLKLKAIEEKIFQIDENKSFWKACELCQYIQIFVREW